MTSDDDNGEDKMEKGARREGVIPSGRRSLISNNIIHYIVNTVNAYAGQLSHWNKWLINNLCYTSINNQFRNPVNLRVRRGEMDKSINIAAFFI